MIHRDYVKEYANSLFSTIISDTKVARKIKKKYPEIYSNVNVEKIRWVVKHWRIAYNNPPKENKNSTFIEKDNEAELTGNAFTLDELLKKADVDLDVWQVDSYEIKENKWDVTMADRDQDLKFEKDEEGKQVMTGYAKRNGQVTKTNKQFFIRVRLKRRTDQTATLRFRKEIIDEVKHYSPVVKLFKTPNPTGNLLELMIPDVHLGKLGWEEETGEPNYDTKIAVKRFNDAIDDLISQATKSYEFEKILFVVGNDFFNSDKDYPFPQTTAGTPQHSDQRWQKVFKTGRKLIVDTIIKLSNIAPVDVLVIPGNHDFQKVFYLGEILEAMFENNENINVNNGPATRKYYQWGNGLIGFEHGRPSDAGMKRIQTLMQYEVPDLWVKTIYREWHMGDIHHWKKAIITSEEDNQGIILRWFRTLMFNDEWEARKGYKSQKGAHAFVWNKERGNMLEFRYNE